MTADGSQMQQLTIAPAITAGQGVLHAHFNPSGNKLMWAYKYDYNGPDQQWEINIADFVIPASGLPYIQTIKSIKPVPGVAFYETMGFSPDGTTIIFAAGSPSTQTLNVYTYDLTKTSTNPLKNLTNTGTGVWNEHSHYARDNSRIIFDSSMNITMTRTYFVPFLDYWTMNTDGSNPVRLTYFNDPSAPEYYQYGLSAADFDFSTNSSVIFGSLEEVQANSSMFYAMAVLKFQY
jgi:hypothetical protein